MSVRLRDDDAVSSSCGTITKRDELYGLELRCGAKVPHNRPSPTPKTALTIAIANTHTLGRPPCQSQANQNANAATSVPAAAATNAVLQPAKADRRRSGWSWMRSSVPEALRVAW